MTRVARGLVVALVALSVGGCAGTPPTGPIEPPEIYPDRTTPESAWQTFTWAWQQGDLEVLKSSLGGWLKADLEAEIAKNGPAKTADYYRRDAQDLVVEDARWLHRGDAICYLRVVLVSRAVPRVEVDFALTGRGSRPSEDWVVTGKKLVR